MGSLRRALALWLQDLLPGVTVAADETGRPDYPLCTISELSYGLRPLGCGRREVRERDPELGRVTRSGRLMRVESVFRVQFSAPSSVELNGAEVVDRLQDALAEGVARFEPGPMVDALADPPVSFPIDRLAMSSRQGLPLDTTGEPFLHRAVTTISISMTRVVDQPVEHVMERIHVNAAGD